MQGVKRHHALLIAAVALAATIRVSAQVASDGAEFETYVVQSANGSGLAESEHLLIFSKTVQVPGATLHAGAYIFRLVNFSFMQVMDADRAKIYTTFGVIPVYYRNNDDGRERIKFQQQVGEESPRMVEWHIPGQTGFEFPYKKGKQQPADRRVER